MGRANQSDIVSRKSHGDKHAKAPAKKRPADDAPRSKKAAKKAAAPEPEPAEVDDDTDEAEPEPEEESAADSEKARKKLRRRREAKKCAGYRAIAGECGFVTGGAAAAAAGNALLMSAVTPADAKRCLRFVPEVLSKSSFQKTECHERMRLSTEPVTDASARVAQGHIEAVMRRMLNKAVFSAVEKGQKRIDAATMLSVLRPHQGGLHFTAVVPPLGLLRHAQINGVLSASAADAEAADDEKAANKELVGDARRLDNAELKRREAFRARKAELAAKRAGEAAAA